MPDLRRLLSSFFRKQTTICPFEIVRGTINNTEAGYQPQGAQLGTLQILSKLSKDLTPIVVEWEDSVFFPFDGTMDQRYDKSPKIRGIKGESTEEKEKVNPFGTVFEYDVDSGKKDSYGQVI